MAKSKKQLPVVLYEGREHNSAFNELAQKLLKKATSVVRKPIEGEYRWRFLIAYHGELDFWWQALERRDSGIIRGAWGGGENTWWMVGHGSIPKTFVEYHHARTNTIFSLGGRPRKKGREWQGRPNSGLSRSSNGSVFLFHRGYVGPRVKKGDFLGEFKDRIVTIHDAKGPKQVVRVTSIGSKNPVVELEGFVRRLKLVKKKVLDRVERPYWIFQANPNKKELSFKGWPVGGEDTWTVTKYGEEMEDGDLVLLWQTGRNAAFRAVVKICGPVRARRKSDGTPYSNEKERRVPIKLVQEFLRPFPSRDELKARAKKDPILSTLPILAGPYQGTNKKINYRQWSALSKLLEIDDEGKAKRSEVLYPELVSEPRTYAEGATKRVYVNKYERDEKARRACLERYKPVCSVCGLDFFIRYGQVGRGFIHVHHLKPLAKIRKSYTVNPIKDLRPVCPNCHAMIHRKDPPYTIPAMKKKLRK